MTHLSPATAHALKAAGFPQPAPAIGQLWHLGEENLKIVLTQDLLESDRFIMPTLGSQFAANYTLDEISQMSFCPTVEELLEVLPYGCNIYKVLNGFVVKHEFIEYSHFILSEALAGLYLDIHETPAP